VQPPTGGEPEGVQSKEGPQAFFFFVDEGSQQFGFRLELEVQPPTGGEPEGVQSKRRPPGLLFFADEGS
jgi:hypothetical protein